MKNFTQDNQRFGHFANSLANDTLQKDKDFQFKAVVLWIKKHI
jgi:hypothetical protein